MCGIAGYILKAPQRHCKQIYPLFKSIRQRGQDDEGACLVSRHQNTYRNYSTEISVDAIRSKYPNIDDSQSLINNDIALLHSRYAIIDLSEGGHQPFISNDNNIIAVFNGEIYNYIELREELKAEGVKFRTASDTEVLVEGYNVWRKRLWRKLNGFWAVVIYDRKEDSVIFSRDRVGVAPLYHLETNEGLFFSSTIQSLIDVSLENISVNHDSIIGFAQTGIKDHDNTTFYNNIKSFPSLSTVSLNANSSSMKKAVTEKYWLFPVKRHKPADLSFDEAVKTFRDLFFSSVDIRLRADVKIAFELSGGLDSSSAVAAAAVLKKDNITTYTVKVAESPDERYAKTMLEKYKIDYRVLLKVEDDFINDFSNFSLTMEEPYDNPNNYTHNIMLKQMKDEGIDVVTTGAGGDEVFAGYEASFWPKAFKELKRSDIRSNLSADWYEFRRRFKTSEDSAATLKHYLFDSLRYLSNKPVGKHKIKTSLRMTPAMQYNQNYNDLSFQEQSLYHFQTALIPYYMRSSDHFTMSIPIEHRFPLLDYRIIEFGLKVPVQYLFYNGWTKYILRKAMEPYLPKGILWRKKKAGFYFPFKSYFRKHLETYKPLLAFLNYINFPSHDFDTYENLLEHDPALLWRLISIAIWAENNIKTNSKIRS